MARLWERLRASPRSKGAFLFVVVAAMIVPAAVVPTPDQSPLADAERAAFDWEMRALRSIHPRPIENDIVLIGIDEDTYAAYPEPLALWHRHFADTLHALARARPRAVAVDVTLPDRSFNQLLAGSDLALMRGMMDLKRSTVLVYVQTVSDRRQLVPFQKNYQGILTPENAGTDQQTFDPDLNSRRFEEPRFDDGSVVVTLAGRILRNLGLPVQEGYIDYSVGAPLSYVPMHVIAGWRDNEEREVPGWTEEQLRKAFAGRIVLLGSLIGGTDRWRLPVRLMERDPGFMKGFAAEEIRGHEQPGVLIHAQVLRNHIANSMLRPLPEPLRWLAMALATLAVLVSGRRVMVMLGAVVVPAAISVLGLASIVYAQILVPVASIVMAFWLALVVRSVFDAVEAVIDRLRLQASFAGQVSPAVMKEMLDGNLAPGVSGQLAEVCVLFSDVRDFTTLSENMPPVVVTTVLQRYFDRMVHAVHRFDGTVDKFIGDGMMVLFGAPRKSADPCGDAVQCALAMMKELDQLNADFEREGLPVLTIGIGINYGTVTVGNIGSSERHNYSAIGDAVNVAARVEGLTKDLGRKIVITEAVVARIGERFHFDPLGTHNVKGHSPVKVWGIRTVRAAPVAAVEAEAIQ
ncbi:MAG TPA: adenylate/guanylate cyclase domain-containing protein [Usitatibacter sp.]|nr:adenylate/guanylate cyclase domain-containing protein [Usitatibacter sp.]